MGIWPVAGKAWAGGRVTVYGDNGPGAGDGLTRDRRVVSSVTAAGSIKVPVRAPAAGAPEDLVTSAHYLAYDGSTVPLVKRGLPLKVIMVLTGGATSVEVLILKR